jgi:hypothetical protein
VVVAIIALSYWFDRKNAQAWRQMAEELGLAYIAKNNDLVERFNYFACFRHGHHQKVHNAIAGDSGEMEVVVADYRYMTGGGKHRHTHHQTLCILSSASLDLPQCLLRPRRRVFDFLGKLFGGKAIEFQDDPVFSAEFVLQGPDEQAVRELFTEPVRAWFMGQDRQVHFEGCGTAMLIHFGRKLKPDRARELMQQALELRKLLPDAGQGKS